MIIFTAEISEALMNLGFDPIGEVNGFWEFADSAALEETVAQLVANLAGNGI